MFSPQSAARVRPRLANLLDEQVRTVKVLVSHFSCDQAFPVSSIFISLPWSLGSGRVRNRSGHTLRFKWMDSELKPGYITTFLPKFIVFDHVTLFLVL